MKNTEIYYIFDKIEEDSKDFYQYLTLGQQVYRTIVYSYIFLNISQDAKNCGQLTRHVSKEDLLKNYIREIGMYRIWESNDYGIINKIRKCFVILGIHYDNKGYDEVYSTMQQATEEYFDNFLNLPIFNYTQFLDKYARDTYGLQISYSVIKEHQYSSKDVIYKASTIFMKKSYSAYGYGKKNAIEQLAKSIVYKIVPFQEKMRIAEALNIVPIKKNILQLNSNEYIEKDQSVLDFANKYGVDPLLMRIALLSRSNVNKQLWDNLGITRPDSFESKENLFKRGLINFGAEIMLLLSLTFNLKKNNLDLVDLSSFDIMNISMAPDEIQERLMKMLNVDFLGEYLYDELSIPIKTPPTSGGKNNVVKGLFTVFFFSNFTPDKKSIQYFFNYFESFYIHNGLNLEVDYRFSLISYLSVLNIRTETNHYEVGNGKYHAEVIIGRSTNSLKYTCENDSMRYAKKEVWHIAYDNLVTSVQEFFFSANENVDKESVLFFIRRVSNTKDLPSTFFSRYGVLNANNYSKIDTVVYKRIINTLKEWLEIDKLKAFINIVCNVNCGKYIYINGQIKSYNDWIKEIALGEQVQQNFDNSELPLIYENIVNPTVDLQKKMITIDYKSIKKIYPLSDQLAEFALLQNIDAYNYLPFISPYISEIYDKIKAETVDLSNIGSLIATPGEDVTISILDSQKPLHYQILPLISKMKIKKITIACGYCFASGLKLIRDVCEPALLSDIPFEMYVGSLQNYDESIADNLITGIDISTVKILNRYLSFQNFKLYTCPDRFYHGKLYMFENEDRALIIMGSSNISRSAFVSNYELNIIIDVSNSNALYKNFTYWVGQLRYYSKGIESMNENMFGANEIKLDGSVLIKHISTESMKSKIRQLSNSEVQYRLNLWMSFSPDIIAEDLGILSLPNYFVFVYRKYNLIVLESFEAGNAYYCLKSSESFEDIINSISTFTKTEIFEFSQMSKRGYHVSNKFTLESNIRSFFRR